MRTFLCFFGGDCEHLALLMGCPAFVLQDARERNVLCIDLGPPEALEYMSADRVKALLGFDPGFVVDRLSAECWKTLLEAGRLARKRGLYREGTRMTRLVCAGVDALRRHLIEREQPDYFDRETIIPLRDN